MAGTVNSNVDSLLALNAIIRQKVLLNDLLGKTVESIYSNVNTEYQLNFPVVEGRNKRRLSRPLSRVIRGFLDQVNIESLVRDAISVTYLEGNRYYYLRVDGGNYVIDKLPIGLCYVSNYEINGKPALEINVKSSKLRLRKHIRRISRKKRNMDEGR